MEERDLAECDLLLRFLLCFFDCAFVFFELAGLRSRGGNFAFAPPATAGFLLLSWRRFLVAVRALASALDSAKLRPFVRFLRGVSPIAAPTLIRFPLDWAARRFSARRRLLRTVRRSSSLSLMIELVFFTKDIFVPSPGPYA